MHYLLFYDVVDDYVERRNVLNGLVKSWKVREWTTVAGNDAALPIPPLIDIITSISGIDWDTAYNGRAKGRYGTVPVNYLGRNEFIANKRFTSRKKDLADLEALGEA